MTGSWRWLGLAMLALGIAISSGTAEAQTDADDARARGHFEAGASYYEQSRYEEAAREFEEAYSLSPRPALLWNVANAHERLGDLEAAIAALERYLGHDVPDRQLAESRLEALRQRHAQATAPPAEESEPEPTSPPQAGGLGDLGLVGLTVGSAGIAAAVAAIVTGVLADETYADLQSRCPDDVCPPDARADVDSGRALAWSSTLLLPISVAMLVAGVTLFTIELTDDDEGAAEQVRLTPGPGMAGLSLEVSFR